MSEQIGVVVGGSLTKSLEVRLEPRKSAQLGQYLVGCWRHDWSSEKVCRSPGCKSTVSSRTKTAMGAAVPGRELTSIRSSENASSTRWLR